jgi:hypothetical protein
MTAVEWLVDKILVQQEISIDEEGEWLDIPRIEYMNGYKSYVDLSAFVNEAKEMEKKDICHFGAKCCFMTTQKKSWTIEELYNETFKTK